MVWPALFLAGIATLFGGVAYWQIHKNGELTTQIEVQQAVIEQQALYQEELSVVLNQREADLEHAHTTLVQTINEWEAYRDEVNDACVNAPHPNLHKWLRQQPNSYFDGDTPARIPPAGI